MNKNLYRIYKKQTKLNEARLALLKVVDDNLLLNDEQDNEQLMNSILDIVNQIDELQKFIDKRIKPTYRD